MRLSPQTPINVRPPDANQGSQSVHGNRLRQRHELRLLGSAPHVFLRSGGFHAMPHTSHNETQISATGQLLSPPVRTRLVFDDDIQDLEERTSSHLYSRGFLASDNFTEFGSDSSVNFRDRAVEQLPRSVLGKRRLSSTEIEAQNSQILSNESQQTIDMTTPEHASRRRSPRLSHFSRGHDEIGERSPQSVHRNQLRKPPRSVQSGHRKTPQSSRRKQVSTPIATATARNAEANDRSEHKASPVRVLFNIKKKRKPQHWIFMKLVCKDEFSHLNNRDLQSEHARCAFCIKYKEEIKFEKSSTSYVTKHMLKMHHKELKAAEETEAARKNDHHQILVHEVKGSTGRSLLQKPATIEEQTRADILATIWFAKSIHLIVGSGIVKKKSSRSAKEIMEAAATDNDFAAALEDEACEAIDTFITDSCEASRTDLDKLRVVVDKFRRLANVFSHSTKAVGCLRDLQSKTNALLPKTDCATRWNSTYAMLLLMIELGSVLDSLFDYVASTGEFAASIAEQPTAEDWFTIRCLIVLLKPFADATEGIGGQKYPTLVIAVPVLCSIERKLKNSTIFDQIVRGAGNEVYKYRVERLMQSIQKTYSTLFSEKLKDKLPEELLWISALDPRSAEFKNLSQDEASLARTRLKSAMIETAKQMQERKESEFEAGQLSSRSAVKCQKANLAWLTDVFSGDLEECISEELTDAEEKLKEKCESELTLYLSDAHGTPVTTNALKW